MDYICYILIGIAVIAAVLELIFFLKPLRNVARSAEPDPSADSSQTGNLPKVTVISNVVSADDDIDEYLETLMNQTYPDYDVVLVYESVAETAAMIAERYAEKYPSLYVTFIPPGSHNLSRRKLAFTLGMKAAKGEVVITTASNVVIPSALWIETMAAPFVNEEIDVALGYSRIDFGDLRGIWKWYREFDTMMTDARWIGYAYCNRPYRGDSNNLAFRRHIFFDHKGYSQTINLQNGDDDLFVNEITDENNSMMISTAKGLAELFLTSAATGEGEAKARAYPNPVRPDYFGYVTIDSLNDNALVKICDAAGNLVKELGLAPGGEAKWDVTDMYHRRVNSGVYHVLASDGPDGSGWSSVTKILVVN